MTSDEYSGDMPTMRLVGITADDEDEVFTVGLAEHSDGSGRALLFMCELDPDSADEDGETYCVCTESQATTYGGVRECVLQDGTLRIKLTRDASQGLGLAQELRIALELDAAALDELREGLRRVLESGPRNERPQRLEL